MEKPRRYSCELTARLVILIFVKTAICGGGLKMLYQLVASKKKTLSEVITAFRTAALCVCKCGHTHYQKLNRNITIPAIGFCICGECGHKHHPPRNKPLVDACEGISSARRVSQEAYTLNHSPSSFSNITQVGKCEER